MIILESLSLPSNSLETWTVGGSTYSWGVSGLQYVTNVVDWNGLAGIPPLHPIGPLRNTSVTALGQLRAVVAQGNRREVQPDES